MKLTKNISLEELQCNCGCKTVYDYPAMIAYELQAIVDSVKELYKIDVYAIITSAARCLDHNKKEGGAKHSKHLTIHKDKFGGGDAVDFYLVNKHNRKKVPLEDVAYVIDTLYPYDKGIIKYNSFIHFDTRQTKYRDI